MNNQEYRTLVGYVRFNAHDYALEGVDGNFYILEFENEKQKQYLPLNTKLGLVVKRLPTDDGKYVIFSGDMFYTPIEE